MSVAAMEVVTLRLPKPLLDRVDALVRRLGKDDEWALRGMDTRAQIMREAMIQGLVILEQASKGK